MINSIILGVIVSISVLCFINLWKRRGCGIGKKIFWSFIVLIPFIGPVFYGGFFNPPRVDKNKKHWPEDRGGIPPGGASFGASQITGSDLKN